LVREAAVQLESIVMEKDKL